MRARRAVLGAVSVGGPAAALPTTASAGLPGRRDLVTSGNLGITKEVGTVRAGDGVLHTAWVRPDEAGAPLTDLLHTPIAPSGAVGAATEITPDCGAASRARPPS